MALKAQNITIDIHHKSIVENISIIVKSNQNVGIIGPNGCGKSTFLKSLYKIITPKIGTVFLDEMDILKEAEKRIAQNIAVVGQFNDLSFDFTVFEMVIMGRSPYKSFMQSDSKQDLLLVDEALKKVDLLAFKNRSYQSLSGGEKQRVILARAIVQNPNLLILDEPTNHLDIKYQLQVLNIVKELKITTLSVLHDLELAARYCDYLYAMKDGKIVAFGTPYEVLTKENILHIYEVHCEVFKNPITNHLSIAYLD